MVWTPLPALIVFHLFNSWFSTDNTPFCRGCIHMQHSAMVLGNYLV